MTRTSEWVSVSSYFFHLKSLAVRTWLLATRLLATRLWLLAARVALCHELLSSAPEARFDAGLVQGATVTLKKTSLIYAYFY